MNLRFILIFSLFGSVTMVILVDPIPYVDAMKSEGTPTLKHGSATKGIVCGDKLCSEIKASERKIQNCLRKLMLNLFKYPLTGKVFAFE